MKKEFKIKLSEKELKHIENCDSIYDTCETVQKIFRRLETRIKESKVGK